MQNIPLILYLGKNLSEYGKLSADHCTFTTLINANFPIDQLVGHKANCKLTVTSQLKYHDCYKRTNIIDTAGQPHCAQIHRLYCPQCRAVWRIYPSILTPCKHYDSYRVQNSLEDVLSNEQSYRAITRQEAQLTSDGEPKANVISDARTPWHWVLWLGQFSLPLVLLACGLKPLRRGIS